MIESDISRKLRSMLEISAGCWSAETGLVQYETIIIAFITDFHSLGGSNPLAPLDFYAFEYEGNPRTRVTSRLLQQMSQRQAGRDQVLRFARCLYLVEEKSLSGLQLRAAFGSLSGSLPSPGDIVVISGDTEGFSGALRQGLWGSKACQESRLLWQRQDFPALT